MAERYEKAKLNQQSIYLDAEDLADLADWYSVRQKRDMAHEVASYGLTLHPENISLLIEQAYLYLDDNNLEAAQQIANQLDSTQTDTKILQAQIYILNNERPKAISLLDTIDEQDDVDTMINVAYMYINVGLPQEALTWLKSGIERYSDDEPFLSVLGDVYYGTKQYDKAIEVYNKLIDKNPYSAFYWFGLARCYFDQQMYNKAIEACDYATISDEDFPDAYLMKGYAFFYLQNDEKADGKIGASGMTSGESQRLGAAGNAFRLNYWGYGPSYLYAVKAAYGSGNGISPEAELKTLVKKLHQEGMECIVELYLTGKEAPDQVLEVLRYWVLEYHVDGFHLSGFPPLLLAGESPFLSEIKLFADNWNELLSRRPAVGYLAPKTGKASVREKHLAEYGPSFQENMRRVLKGDEGMVQALAWHIRRNPADHAVINYMANTNGFTMADMVSYDRKHNENNGEENRDGSDYNYSWNCGEEGATKKKKIKKLRWQQLKNAYLLLFLSQGTPLLLAGDEFGNSQEGNNNAYCQDNEISWLDWRLAETNRQQLEFVRGLIAFRKAHPVFHMDREPRIMDYRSCGRPDLSYHGENAWKPEYEAFRRQLGVLYWGPYQLKEDQTEDDTFYVIFNMHWEPHMFGLPRLPQGQEWRIVCDSAKETADGAFSKENELPLKNQLHTAAAPRSILILRAEKKEPNKKEPKKKEAEKKEPKKEA